MKPIILSLESFGSTPVNEKDAQHKINELQRILELLEEKEKTVKDIHVDCEQYGVQYGDVQKFIRELLLGLTSNIHVIRENQNCIRAYLDKLLESPKDHETQTPIIEERILTEAVKPETHAMSTQTRKEQSTDNIMVIQSMNAEGETIQIYNMPCSHDEDKEDDTNVIVEAKYIRGHSGEPKRASELVLKNVPKHFETTFVEPDETTTEIIVDPDGSKRIIVRKLTKSTQQIVKHEEYEGGVLPEHIRSQLGLSGTTHDVIVGSPDDPSFEQHTGITESSIHAVIEHVSHRIIKKTRKIIKKIVIIDGQEHITEEVIEEPDEVEEFSGDRPEIEYEISNVEPTTEILTIEQQEVVAHAPEGFPAVQENIITVVETLKPDPVIEVIPEKTVDPEVTDTVVEKALIEAEPTVEEVEMLEIQPEEKAESEGENQPKQVFETVTEAPVELIASEVDKLAPIEDISRIWPYETPHIASQSTVTEITESPAPTQQDKNSQEIWPLNLTIGSNIDFNEYSFDRTLEKSSDYLDNDSFVIIDPGLVTVAEEQSNLLSRFAEEEILEPKEPVESSEIQEKPIEETVEIVQIESKVEEEIPQEEIITPQTKDENAKILQQVVVAPVEEKTEPIITQSSRPTSPPQMATITIVKTMTFLEQERINAEATMTITREPLIETQAFHPSESFLIEETTDAKIELSEIEASKEIKQEPKVDLDAELSLDESTVSQLDRSLPEEMVQCELQVTLSEENITKEEEVTSAIDSPAGQPDESIISQIESEMIGVEDVTDASIIPEIVKDEKVSEVIKDVEISEAKEKLLQPIVESQVPEEPKDFHAEEPLKSADEATHKAEELPAEPTEVEETVVSPPVEHISEPTSEVSEPPKDSIVSQTEMFISSEVESSSEERSATKTEVEKPKSDEQVAQEPKQQIEKVRFYYRKFFRRFD